MQLKQAYMKLLKISFQEIINAIFCQVKMIFLQLCIAYENKKQKTDHGYHSKDLSMLVCRPGICEFIHRSE